jgi:RNA polymerase sigma-70 factor (ECF subfamily)
MLSVYGSVRAASSEGSYRCSGIRTERRDVYASVHREMTRFGISLGLYCNPTVPQEMGAMAGLADDTGRVRDLQADDGRALEAFVAAHHGRLLRLAGLVGGDVASAEDIVQTALERAWRSRRSLIDDARLRPWLDRIVVREAARERRWRLLWLDRLIRPPTITEIPTPRRDLEDEGAGRFPDRLPLRQAFGALTRAQRAVVVLHLHAGYTLDETAEILGIPRETVRSRLRVARDHLRHALQEGS